MKALNLKCLSALVILLALLPIGWADDRDTSADKGTFVVLVTWGDVDNTPADDVYIEAHGFVREYNSEKSYTLSMSRAGRYEASLPPGVYDVFVSEGVSVPACKRVLIRAGETMSWTLKLENDYVYTDKSSTGVR